MANENIKIVISESGSRVVIRNMREIAESAENAAKSSDKMNSSLGKSNNHNFGRLRSEFSKLDTSLTRTVYKIRQMMTLFAAFAGTTISTGAIVKAMDSYTNLQNRLKLVADSQSQVNELTKEMFDIAKRSRASVEDTAIAFSRFDLALKSVGRSQKDSLVVTETVNKMIAMSGKGSQEAGAALLQLSQAFSKGKLDGDEFRTVAETMPLLMDAIAKKMGVTRGELLELRKQGKLTLDVMIEAIRDAQPEVDKQFGGYKMRVSDALTELKNQWIKFWGELDAKMGISSDIADALLWLSQNLKLVAAIGTVAFIALAAVISGPVIAAFKALAFFIAANPYLALGAAIAGVVTYLILMEDEMRESNTLLAEIGANTVDLIKSIPSFVEDALATVLFGYQEMGRAFGDLWNEMVDTAEGGNKKVTDAAKDSTVKQYQSYSEMIGLTKKDFWGFLEWLAMVYDMIGSIAAAAFDYAYENIKIGLENTISWMDGKLTEASNLFKRTFNFLNFGGVFGDNLKETPVVQPQYKEHKTWNKSFIDGQSTFARDLVFSAASKFEEATGRSTSIVKKETSEREKLSKTLRGENSDLMKKLKDKEAKSVAEKAGRASKSESQTFAEKTAEFAEKNARALDKYTGECAKYINNAVQAFAKNYKRAGSGIDVARNAVATGKYKWVKFDENYTPQVGDIQSMSSWTKLGLKHGHSAMFTKNGWVSDAKQKTYGDGRIGAAGYDQYNKLKSGIGQLMIARPIDSKIDNRTYNKLYEQQEKSLEKQIEYYDNIIAKTEKEIQNLTNVGTTRLADMKTMELMDSLKQHDVDLTTEQVKKVAELALKYEEAKVAQELREVAESREKELVNLRAITIEEKAIAAFNNYIASRRKEGIFYTDEQLKKLREESIEHAKTVELLQAKNDLWLNQSKELENLIVKQQALNELIASGQMPISAGLPALAKNQAQIAGGYQGMGLNGFGGQTGVSPIDDLLGSMLASSDKLLEGYTGTLNDLTGLFGNFFTSIEDGFANSIGRAIVYSENLGDALKNIGRDALQQLISGLIKMGIQWLITQALMRTSSKVTAVDTMAQGVIQGQVLASAYAPAAMLANIATLGSAGAIGVASTTAALSVAKALPLAFAAGFSEGGYTGNGGVNDIAGVVHGQEFVMDAQTTRRIGVSNLEALRNGSLALSNGASVNGGQSGGITVKIENYASGVSHEVEQISETEIRIIARKEAQQVLAENADSVVASNIRNNSSRTSLAINSNFDVRQRR